MKYDIHIYRTENLSPDELSMRRKGQDGVWILKDTVTAANARSAAAQGRVMYPHLRVRAANPR